MAPHNAMLSIRRPTEKIWGTIDSLKKKPLYTDLFIYTRSVHSRKQCSKLLLSVIMINYHDKKITLSFGNYRYLLINDVILY